MDWGGGGRAAEGSLHMAELRSFDRARGVGGMERNPSSPAVTPCSPPSAPIPSPRTRSPRLDKSLACFDCGSGDWTGRGIGGWEGGGGVRACDGGRNMGQGFFAGEEERLRALLCIAEALAAVRCHRLE